MAEPRLVSVVMSVFNDAARVPYAIESICKQTLHDWELILIDDGSTDETAHVVDAYAERDDRIRVVHQQNAGLTRALIRGCAMARGPFIARQDADDWSHPERLERQRALLESDDRIGFVSCRTQYVGPRGERLQVVKRPSEPALATRQLLTQRQGPPAHGSVMFRRALYERVGGYRGAFFFAQDSDLWLRMAEQAWIAYCPEILYTHRRDPESLSGVSGSAQHRFGDLGQACRRARAEGASEEPFIETAWRLTAELREQSTGAHLPRSNGFALNYLIGSQLAQNGDRRALSYLWQALRLRPWHWKAWGRVLQSAFSGSETGSKPKTQ